MITKVLNPHTGRFWHYEIEYKLLSKDELKQLLDEIKDLIKKEDLLCGD